MQNLGLFKQAFPAFQKFVNFRLKLDRFQHMKASNKKIRRKVTVIVRHFHILVKAPTKKCCDFSIFIVFFLLLRLRNLQKPFSAEFSGNSLDSELYYIKINTFGTFFSIFRFTNCWSKNQQWRLFAYLRLLQFPFNKLTLKVYNVLAMRRGKNL